MSSKLSRAGAATVAGASPADVQAELRGLSTEIDRLDGIAADRFGLNRTDLRALDLIRTSGVIAPTELARALGFTTGGVTTVIDRLERAGFLRRTPDPADRRRLVLEPTSLLLDRESEVFGPLGRETGEMIATFDAAELATIGQFLRRSRDITAAHVDRLLAGGRPPDAETAGTNPELASRPREPRPLR
jgi:DNA-binding MarR family transcriptional regulator